VAVVAHLHEGPAASTEEERTVLTEHLAHELRVLRERDLRRRRLRAPDERDPPRRLRHAEHGWRIETHRLRRSERDHPREHGDGTGEESDQRVASLHARERGPSVLSRHAVSPVDDDG
jgi:hypothetical protein